MNNAFISMIESARAFGGIIEQAEASRADIVNNLIYQLQGGESGFPGYVTFNDETGFPSLGGFGVDALIVAVKVDEDGRLLVFDYDCEPDEDNLADRDCWLDPADSRDSLDTDSLLNCLLEVVRKDTPQWPDTETAGSRQERVEMLNRIELVGRVGSVRVTEVGSHGHRLARFSMLTEYAFKNESGGIVLESTWHNVAAFEGRGIDISGLVKGARVHVTGRLRAQHYTGEDGTERTSFEVVASTVGVAE